MKSFFKSNKLQTNSEHTNIYDHMRIKDQTSTHEDKEYDKDSMFYKFQKNLSLGKEYQIMLDVETR